MILSVSQHTIISKLLPQPEGARNISKSLFSGLQVFGVGLTDQPAYCICTHAGSTHTSNSYGQV